MDGRELPNYSVFDDYRFTQRIAVVVRWFLIVIWLFLHNYRPDLGTAFIINNVLALTLAAVNGYVTWRIWRGRPITRGYVLALSAMDLAFITTGIGVSSAFGNTFFVLYYPALLGLSLVFSSRRLSFAAVALVAGAYAAISLGLEPGVSFADREERVLIIRIGVMFAVVAAANLMTRIERTSRREAVEAERLQAQRNLELQSQAQEAELAAQEERSRIAREIHDGIAQSIYMLSLHLETLVDLAEQRRQGLRERLENLMVLSKQALLEVRHYIFDLKPYMAGEKGVVGMVENQVKEFNKVAGVAATLDAKGEDSQLRAPVAACLYRMTQEALANTFKHADASAVTVELEFTEEDVRLTVQDNGRGFDGATAGTGHGVASMRQRAEELGGAFDLSAAPDEGTKVFVRLPR